MPRRKNRYTLDQTPIAVRVRILVGTDNKTFYVMRRVGKKWKKTRFKASGIFRWETLDYEESLEVLEKELCKVLHSETRRCLSKKIYLIPVNKYPIGQYENLVASMEVDKIPNDGMIKKKDKNISAFKANKQAS